MENRHLGSSRRTTDTYLKYAPLPSIRRIRDGTLSCDIGQRYLRLGQVHSREEICGSKVVQIDSISLYSTGVFVRSASFDKVLYQVYTSEKGLAMFGL
jgi:hypothetical protein